MQCQEPIKGQQIVPTLKKTAGAITIYMTIQGLPHRDAEHDGLHGDGAGRRGGCSRLTPGARGGGGGGVL